MQARRRGAHTARTACRRRFTGSTRSATRSSGTARERPYRTRSRPESGWSSSSRSPHRGRRGRTDWLSTCSRSIDSGLQRSAQPRSSSRSRWSRELPSARSPCGCMAGPTRHDGGARSAGGSRSSSPRTMRSPWPISSREPCRRHPGHACSSTRMPRAGPRWQRRSLRAAARARWPVARGRRPQPALRPSVAAALAARRRRAVGAPRPSGLRRRGRPVRRPRRRHSSAAIRSSTDLKTAAPSSERDHRLDE